MNSKDFYKSYQADDKVGFIGEYLLVKIKEENPQHVLDFGCGSGKHIDRLNREGIPTIGVDISLMNIQRAKFKYDLPCVVCSDETYLRNLCNVDVVFTVSVLDHIKDIDEIIAEFKRISNKCVYLAETNDAHVGEFYYKHSYEKLGFKKLKDFEWKGEDGAMYYIWKWTKEEELFAGLQA